MTTPVNEPLSAAVENLLRALFEAQGEAANARNAALQARASGALPPDSTYHERFFDIGSKIVLVFCDCLKLADALYPDEDEGAGR